MSVYAMEAVWQLPDLDPYEKLVLLSLADHKNEDDEFAYPSIAALVQRTGMGERGIQKVLRRLSERGLLEIIEGGGRHQRNRYRLRLDPAPGSENPAPGAPFDGKPRTGNPVSGSETPHPVPPLDTQEARNPAPGSENPAPGAPEPEENQKKKESAPDGALVGADADAPDPPPPDPVPLAVIAFNAAAERQGWPRVQKLTAARKAALRSRLRDVGGIEGWQAALAKAEASDFLCGRSARGSPFKASFDFLTRESSFVKLMEGSYDNRPDPSRGPAPIAPGGGRPTSLASVVARRAAQRAARGQVS